VKAGAIGYLLKDTEAEELCRSIKAAAEGKVQLAPEAAARLMREVNTPEEKGDSLSARELEVLQELAAGFANKEIARHMKIGESTVKTHVTNILLKLGVQSRTQAALFAAQRGIANLPGL
jgi:DNA-binding NarL/FixJ family response regulator